MAKMMQKMQKPTYLKVHRPTYAIDSIIAP